MNKRVIISICLIFMALLSQDMYGQRTRTKERTPTNDRRTREDSRKPEPFDLKEKLNTEIKIGNIGLGSSFAISLKPSVGYKFNDRFSAGVGARGQYTFINRINSPDESYFDIGGFGYGRAKIAGGVYFQGEFTTYSFDNGNSRSNLAYPLFGGGYLQEGENWSYGLEILFIGDGKARDAFGSVVEYWISFSHNF